MAKPLHSLLLLFQLSVTARGLKLTVVYGTENRTEVCTSSNGTTVDGGLCGLIRGHNLSCDDCTMYLSLTPPEDVKVVNISQPSPLAEAPDSSGVLTPGTVAAIVVCVLLAIGCAALLVVLYAMQQRQKSYMSSLDRRSRATEMSRPGSRANLTDLNVEKHHGEINPAFEAEKEIVYYSAVTMENNNTDNHSIKDSKTVDNSDNGRARSDTADTSVYEPVGPQTTSNTMSDTTSVTTSNITSNIRAESKRKYQKKESKENLHKKEPGNHHTKVERQETLYDEPWDSNHESMLSVVMQSVVNSQVEQTDQDKKVISDL